jgi:hypothetical protein
LEAEAEFRREALLECGDLTPLLFASIRVIRGLNFRSDKFSRIQDAIWIENLFQLVMQVANNWTGGLRPPTFFGQANSMLASDYTAPGQYLFKKIVERALDFVANGRVAVVPVRHDVDVNVAVTGMTKARDRESVF